MAYEKIHVESYSGYKADERPTAFTHRDRRWEVAKILDRWYEGGLEAQRPQASYFKVRTTDGTIFVLRYISGEWVIFSPASSP